MKTKNATLVDRFNERLDVSLFAKDKRDRIVDWNASGIVATVLQATEAIEEDFQDVSSLSVHPEIQIRKYPAHFSLLPLVCYSMSVICRVVRENGEEEEEEEDDFIFFLSFFLSLCSMGSYLAS